MRLFKTFLATAALAPLFASMGVSSAKAQGTIRIGYIDSQAILQDTPGAKEAQEQFERDMARYRAEVDQMGQQLQEMIQAFEQQQLTLSPEAKESQAADIQARQAEYQQRVADLEGQAGQRQAELVQPIMSRVMEAIDEIRQEGGYAVIFDLSAQAIVAADPSLDLTQTVITRLQEKADASEGAAPAGSR